MDKKKQTQRKPYRKIPTKARYHWGGVGLTISFANNKSVFLQGDDATAVEDRLNEAKTEQQIQDILHEYYY